MKTLGIVLSTAGLAVAAATLVATPADAASCGRGSSIASAPILRDGKPPRWGTIRLVRDNCSRYYAEITMGTRLGRNAKSNAYLVQYGGSNHGRVWSCDSSGGTDAVVAGQRTCRTPKIKSTDRDVTFVAIAREFHDLGAGYREISENRTARTR